MYNDFYPRNAHARRGNFTVITAVTSSQRPSSWTVMRIIFHPFSGARISTAAALLHKPLKQTLESVALRASLSPSLLLFLSLGRGKKRKEEKEMRAVTGSVASSKRVSVSKAAAILSRFAAAETGARRDVAAYLKRASAAFDEIVCFHREVRDGRRRPERGRRVEEKEARRKKRAGSDGKPNPREVEGNPTGRPEEIRWIREVEDEKEVMVDGGDGNLTEVEGDYGGGIGRGEDGKRNSKKKGVNDEKESSELVGRNERKMEVEGERRKEEKKRRETGEEGRDGAGKKRRNSDDGEENEGGGLDDQSERHKKRKKRRKIGMEE